MSDPAMTDHAELARLAKACVSKPVERSDGFTDWSGVAAHEAFIAAANPARVLALLAEIAALRTENTGLRRLRDDLRETTNAYQARYRRAERQRDEAVGLVGQIVGDAFGCNEDSCLVSHRMIGDARTFLASMGPKT